MNRKKNDININLLIKKEAESYSNQFLKWALTYGRYIIIITQIIVLSVFFARFKLDRDKEDLEDIVSQKQSLVESLKDIETDFVTTQTKLGYIKEIISNQDLPLNLINYFQNNTPTDTVFNSLNVRSDSFSLTATSASLKTFSYFLNTIQKEKAFVEISLDEIKRQTDGRIEFRIRAQIVQGSKI